MQNLLSTLPCSVIVTVLFIGCATESSPPNAPILSRDDIVGAPPFQPSPSLQIRVGVIESVPIVFWNGDEQIPVVDFAPTLRNEARLATIGGSDPKEITVILGYESDVPAVALDELRQHCNKAGFGKVSLQEYKNDALE